jgi:hypothetical protein
MIDVTVPVPEERLADFYAMYSRWLSSPVTTEVEVEEANTKSVKWSDTAEDLVLARTVWSKLSDRAKALFTTLMDNPEKKFSGEELAQLHDVPNGKYGVAGVLAWPGRHSAAVNRWIFWGYEDGPVGASANYWMTSEVAALFRKARDTE